MLSSRCASSRSVLVCVASSLSLFVAACGGSAFDVGDDDGGADTDQGGGDTGSGDGHVGDGGSDSRTDGGGDAHPTDTGSGGDTGKIDGGGDATTDSGVDGGSDSGVDTGVVDTGVDTGPSDTCVVTTCYSGPAGTDGVGLCHSGTSACAGAPCVGEVVPTAEVCDTLDNDCNGTADDGNPGGGTSCGPSLGGCVSVTTCVGGSLVCRGTFVAPSPTGSSGNPGTEGSPLDTIDAAIVNAGLIGGGADVCVCAPTGAGATFNENVTMVEGTSVLGGYHCTDWSRAIGTYITRIQDVDADGVNFPAAITSVTALDGMTVLGQALSSGVSTAVTVTDSSPTLVDDTVAGGATPTSIGLAAGIATGASSPTITRGTYTANATLGGSQYAVVLDHSSATIANATIGSFPPAGSFNPATAVGLRCIDCGATTISGGSVRGGGATAEADGMWASGNVAGMAVSGGTGFFGGNASNPAGVARGVFLDTCTGSSTFTSSNAGGGGGATGERIGMDVTGASCSPSIVGGFYSGCEVGATCIGLRANASPVTVSIAPAGSPGPTTLFGAGSAQVAEYGVRCLSGGCASITGTTINPGNIASTATIGIGADIVGSKPLLDSDNIRAPGCAAAGGSPPSGSFYALHLSGSDSIVTNDVIRDQSCATLEEVVRFEKVLTTSPTVVNDTIEYTACAACGTRHGIAILGSPAGGSGAAGIFNNDIVRNIGAVAGGTSYPVYEYDVGSDMSSFMNNDLWDTTAAGLFYFHGTTSLATAALVNTTVPSASGNISANPSLTATWHLNSGSPCIDTGTATSAPTHDFDNPPDARPYPAAGSFDIGADEWHP